ncbi:MAG: rRNA pseudouridine synthase [Syntrophomonadaceae bacterium]|nr:rRNA pseudouridine synthase [Syntrophomonadaceae bacterium]
MEKIRLSRFLASAGVASRRKAEEYISKGRVTVNGRLITVQGHLIDPSNDFILCDGRPAQSEKRVYILLNKPPGYLSAASDNSGRPVVVDLIKNKSARIYPVGRLDLNTEGLLILTNDGDFANRIIHPRYGITRKYEALAAGVITENTVRKMGKGLFLEDGFSGPAKIKILAYNNSGATKLTVEITSGKKRIVRRLLKAAGHPVLKLKRTALAFLTLGGLKRGEYRNLTPAEVEKFYFLA